MSLSFEALLVLGIIAFYLYDSAMLLFSNEIVLLKSRTKWTYACPGSTWGLRGKSPYLPNPLTPGRALFRVTWSLADAPLDAAEVEKTVRFIRSLRPVSRGVDALLALMCGGMPAVIYRFGTGIGFFITLGTIYLSIFSLLLLVYRKRADYQLSTKAFFGLAFDAIACPPFAINLVRKLSTRLAVRFDAVAFAHCQLDRQPFSQLAQALLAKLNEELEVEGADSPRFREIGRFRDKLMRMAA